MAPDADAGDDLRGPLARQIERLADDLVIGRHGDPHFAVAVLVYPDREPAVILVNVDRSPRDITGLRRPKDDTGPRLPFPMAEFEEAHAGLNAADFGLRILSRRGPMEPGVAIGEHIKDVWGRRRMAPIERELRKADEERARPAVCPYCSFRFTERGLPMHLRKAAICSRKHLAATNQELDASG